MGRVTECDQQQIEGEERPEEARPANPKGFEQEQKYRRNRERDERDDERMNRKERNGGRSPELIAARSEAVGDAFDQFDVGHLEREAVLFVEERSQVDDANVALAYAEQIACDDRLEIELVQLELRDRLNARRALDRALRKPIVALLDLVAVVNLDRPEVDPARFEIGGDVVEVIGIAQHLVARSEEDQRARLFVLQEAREQRVDLALPVALVVLDARNQQQLQPARERERLGRQPEAERAEEIVLRADRQDGRARRAQGADGMPAEMQVEGLPIARNLALVIDQQVEFVGAQRVATCHTRQRRLGERRQTCLRDELRARQQDRRGTAIDVGAKFFRNGERSQAGAAQRHQQLLFIICVGTRQRRKVGIIHRQLDATRGALFLRSISGDEQGGDYPEDERDRQNETVASRSAHADGLTPAST